MALNNEYLAEVKATPASLFFLFISVQVTTAMQSPRRLSESVASILATDSVLSARLVIDSSGIDSESGIDSVLSGFRIGIDSAPPFSPWNRSRIQLL